LFVFSKGLNFVRPDMGLKYKKPQKINGKY
jgi:hypothetical protein